MLITVFPCENVLAAINPAISGFDNELEEIENYDWLLISAASLLLFLRPHVATNSISEFGQQCKLLLYR